MENSTLTSTPTLSLTFIGEQLTIYCGIIILLSGVLGGVLNIIVFLSLKTFRESSCAFYLTVMSFVNIGQLLLGLLSRIMISEYGIDWSSMSLFFCKFRFTFFQFCVLMSYTCLCLATIDQYFATCFRPRWQRWSDIKIAHRLTILFTILWSLHMIPYPILLNYVTIGANRVICLTRNYIMLQYSNYVGAVFLSGFIPAFITVLFGSMAYCNIQQIPYRTVPLVRRELDKQLTIMVLVQVILNLFTNVPCVTLNLASYYTMNISNTVISERILFAYTITMILFYSYFASSFYIYICVSERFRRQLVHVLFVIYLKRQRPPMIFINQIAPI